MQPRSAFVPHATRERCSASRSTRQDGCRQAPGRFFSSTTPIGSPVPNVLLSQLMFGPEVFVDFNAAENRSIVFTSDEVRRGNTDLRISAVVFAILLFDGHAYIASSASSARECLGIQDGVLHFISDMPRTAAAAVESFEIDRARSPRWVIVEDQR
jgi:hypothetical protein